MTTVLVTGGVGIIGAWVTRQLVEMGHGAVTYGTSADTALLKDIKGKFKAEVGDVRDLPVLLSVIQKYRVERIIHMATVAHTLTDSNPRLGGYEINAGGSINVLDAARLNDIRRVVYVSSKGVYDSARGEYAHPTYRPINEDYPKAPSSVYGVTKLYMEGMSMMYNKIYGLDSIVVRFANVYGPGKQARHPRLAVLSRMIESAMLGQPVEIAQGGDQIDDMVYHRDCAAGVVAACFADNPKHHVFHIGTGKGVTIRDVGSVLEQTLGVKFKIGPGLDYFGGGQLYGILDISRARQELGYQPRYDIEKGVKDYIDTLKRLDIKPVIM